MRELKLYKGDHVKINVPLSSSELRDWNVKKISYSKKFTRPKVHVYFTLIRQKVL